ncbi:DNA primase [Candidatus Kaiserbacteria bacterium]|nr:DNA primase [Candidatus Kaiserbacteria bacterium]
MSDSVEKIKEKISILDVVQPYVKLVRAGKYWKGLSPFTKEKTPSFFVSPDRGLYHCFSTGKGGDMFTFVEEMEGVDFRGALKILAEKAGVEITPQKAGEKDTKERLYTILEAASEFFEHTLLEKKDALEYLSSRGIAKESVAEWHLGYASNSWQSLREHLLQKGFTDQECERAGLVKKADAEEEKKPEAQASRLYDRFRGRIMFPMWDVSGRVIGFSGRIFEDDPIHPQAKYLNSPETPVFDKSLSLYGIDRAKEGIRALGAVILVEGQMDLLAAHQAGYRNTVATSGTAFTERHAELLKRYTPNLLISYDGDKAGVNAAGRAAAVALRAGMNVKIAKLPAGADPAELAKDNLPLLKESIKGALHVVDFYLAHIADAKYDQRTFRLEVSRTVLPYVAMIGNKIDQAHFIKRVAEVLQVPEDAVSAEVKKAGSGQSITESPGIKTPVPSAEPFLSRSDTIERLLYGLMLLFKENGNTEEETKARGALETALSKDDLVVLGEENAKRAAVFEADLFLERHADPGVLSRELDELCETLKRESMHERYRDTLSLLRAADLAHDDKKTEELMHTLSTLASGLR